MKKVAPFLAALAALAASATLSCLVVGCGSKQPPKPAEPAMTDVIADAGAAAAPEDAAPAAKSLYDRLGGKEGVDKIVDSLVKNVTADPVVKKVFAKTTGPRLDAFKKNLTDQICEATGGGCTYAGKDMKAAHAGMKVNDKEWDAFVNDLTLALQENNVGDKEQNELLIGIFAPMKDDIVVQKKK